MSYYGVPGFENVCEDNTINLVWQAPYKMKGGAFMLAPLPTLSIHLHYGVVSYFQDVMSWWESAEVS